MSTENHDRDPGPRRATSSFDAYIAEIKHFQLLSHEDEIALSRRAAQGDREATERLISCNLKLVIAIAKRYMFGGMSIMDLIEEGNLGLMKAVKRYDPDLGYRFGTYAGWWIRQAILRALANQARTIRLPVYKHNLVCRYKRTKEGLRQKLERDPSEEEMAKALKTSLRKVRDLATLVPEVVPLDGPVGEEEEENLLSMIRDPSVKIPYEVMRDIFVSEQVLGLLESLGKRERTVLEYRFGVGKDRRYTLQEVGEIMHLSRERIRQIETRALARLKEGLSLVEGSEDADFRGQQGNDRKTEGRDPRGA